MQPRKPRSADYALNVLYRQRQAMRKWGLVALFFGLVGGALAAPHTTLLIFLALVVFGVFGGGVSLAMRAFGRWFDRPRS